MRYVRFVVMLVSVFLGVNAAAEELPQSLRRDIDAAAAEVLAQSGAPSVSIAVVRNGSIAYTQAYGLAQLQPRRPAATTMRYSIGSISKQFTAAAILLLAEEGRLSLDDRIIRWFPDLTRAGDVTVRHLLSMTSGYQDFWPQDYVMPMMMEDVTPQEIAERWAKIPLDFEPGTKSQYSNTNYVLAGMIIEAVTGRPYMEFLHARIFKPLGMTTVYDTDQQALPEGDAMRHQRFALATPRIAPKEGKGWMFAAGQLAMTAEDLARWNVSVIGRSLLKKESYRLLETEMQLQSGVGIRYGLGVSIANTDNRRSVSHGGEVSGFTAQNIIYPDEKVAVSVLTNLDASGASGQLASKIATLVFKTADASTETTLTQMKQIFASLQKGSIDRSLFTANQNAYFSETALADFKSSLKGLGTPLEFVQAAQSTRGGMTLRRYNIRFAKKSLRLTAFIMPDGKIEQYLVSPAE